MSKLFASLLIFVFASFSFGQQIHSHMSTMGSLADTKDGKYSSIDLGFSIDLPDSPHGFSEASITKREWRLKEGFFMAGTFQYQRDAEHADDFEQITESLSDGVFRDFARGYFKTGAEPTKREKKAANYDGRGMEFRITLPQSLCLIRIQWVKNRAYITGALLAGKQSSNEQAVLRVFDSMRIFTPESIAAVIAEKVREKTPSPLPQSPVVKKLRSDAEDSGLKGKVKEVRLEDEITGGVRAKPGKKAESEDIYDESGNLLKSTGFDYQTGYPEKITVYGYLNGYRVSKSNRIRFEEGMPGILVNLPPGTKPDERYDTKYSYKYDATGKLSEKIEQFIFQTTRTVFKNTGDTTGVTIYHGPKLGNRWTIKRDEKGNELEITVADPSVKNLVRVYRYNYVEFDGQNNWTKRVETEFLKVADKLVESSARAQYRTITYY